MQLHGNLVFSYHIATDLAKVFGERFSGGDLNALKSMVNSGFLGKTF